MLHTFARLRSREDFLMSDKKVRWTRFNRYLFRYWKTQLAVFVIGFILIPLGLINPYLTKLVIDRAYGNRDLRLFFTLAAIGAAVFILQGIFNSISSYLSRKISRKVVYDLTADVFAHMQRLPLRYFQEKSTGEHLYKVNNDVRSVAEFVCTTIPQMIMVVPKFVFVLVIVFTLNWKLALVACMLAPLSYIQPFYFGRWIRDITRQVVDRSQNVFKRLHEVFSHMHLVKALGKESHEIRTFDENLRHRLSIELQRAKVTQFSTFSAALVNKAVSGIIGIYGGAMVISGEMTLGSLTAVMIYLTQLVGHTKSFGSFYQTILVSSVSRQRLHDIFEQIPFLAEDSCARDVESVKGALGFDSVTFGYSSAKKILDGFSLAIPAGTKVALVGPSGCGKTTLLSLLLRLFRPWEGRILIDGIPLSEITHRSLRGHIGIALQEPFLWNDTIAANIMYGGARAGFREVQEAASISEAHDFITRLPGGYESDIGEMACKLSEGQKQRIAFARSVMQRPRIMLLDEALSSVDSETEANIIDNVRRAFRNSTILMVSHRLSAVKRMDSVIYLRRGSKAKTATHEEFMQTDGSYRELFTGQW